MAVRGDTSIGRGVSSSSQHIDNRYNAGLCETMVRCARNRARPLTRSPAAASRCMGSCHHERGGTLYQPQAARGVGIGCNIPRGEKQEDRVRLCVHGSLMELVLLSVNVNVA